MRDPAKALASAMDNYRRLTVPRTTDELMRQVRLLARNGDPAIAALARVGLAYVKTQGAK